MTGRLKTSLQRLRQKGVERGWLTADIEEPDATIPQFLSAVFILLLVVAVMVLISVYAIVYENLSRTSLQFIAACIGLFIAMCLFGLVVYGIFNMIRWRLRKRRLKKSRGTTQSQ